nr:myristylated protein [Wadden Sea poxvirus]
MGNSYNIPHDIKRKLPTPKPTEEMKLDTNKMFNLISSLNQYNTLYIGRVDLKKKTELKKIFPEFIFTDSGPQNLTAVTRSKYTNNIICCNNLMLSNYWTDDKNNIYDNYKFGRYLNSCDPNIYDIGICDNHMLNYCKNIKKDNSCNTWLNSVIHRYDNTIKEQLFLKLINLCTKDVTIPICEEFLHSLRFINNETTNNIIDYILELQNDDFKNTYMKCSYPSDKTLLESFKYNETRECWDPECAKSNVNFLLTKNYQNLGLCTINKCNINIDNINIDKTSNIRMSCGGNYDDISTSPINRERVILHNVNNSFDLKISDITILSIILIWILIVAI